MDTDRLSRGRTPCLLFTAGAALTLFGCGEEAGGHGSLETNVPESAPVTSGDTITCHDGSESGQNGRPNSGCSIVIAFYERNGCDVTASDFPGGEIDTLTVECPSSTPPLPDFVDPLRPNGRDPDEGVRTIIKSCNDGNRSSGREYIGYGKPWSECAGVMEAYEGYRTSACTFEYLDDYTESLWRDGIKITCPRSYTQPKFREDESETFECDGVEVEDDDARTLANVAEGSTRTALFEDFCAPTRSCNNGAEAPYFLAAAIHRSFQDDRVGTTFLDDTNICDGHSNSGRNRAVTVSTTPSRDLSAGTKASFPTVLPVGDTYACDDRPEFDFRNNMPLRSQDSDWEQTTIQARDCQNYVTQDGGFGTLVIESNTRWEERLWNRPGDFTDEAVADQIWNDWRISWRAEVYWVDRPSLASAPLEFEPLNVTMTHTLSFGGLSLTPSLEVGLPASITAVQGGNVTIQVEAESDGPGKRTSHPGVPVSFWGANDSSTHTIDVIVEFPDGQTSFMQSSHTAIGLACGPFVPEVGCAN